MSNPAGIPAPTPVDDRVSGLGEGPVWDVRTNSLRWVDIPAGVVHHSDGSSRQLPPPASAILPTVDGWAAVLRDRVVELDGQAVAAVPLGAAERCNDAKADPAGRVWVGTMSGDERPGGAALLRLDGAVATEVISGATIANGLGWSPDARRMYWIDTPTRRIDVLDYDLADGSVRGRRPFVAVDPDAGWPDGLAVDAEGALWVALWGGSALHRYTPDGRLDTVLPIGAACPTSCAFGGEDLRTLYITTAHRPDEQGRFAPDAGKLHAVRVPVPGPPPTPAVLPWGAGLPAGATGGA
ncbi:calcium-binding protein [Kitasatospora herbaricolor]|uniref:SMP-30/gluconolactonase/LRE family protein n=1 Tax=Kitasatospora herbaricolor TaxID=68217 RepID=UPI0017481CD9|nr:SMP-30/gluconolactonase/LRE family protein [Kitasatospora herbaricolor]MDQ0312277.1 sugar lactone lactonase YvrE [Kitasatospora herbaricolor]GGV14767.1 calcium-binding protein [Kitasatospora herbaricolor]